KSARAMAHIVFYPGLDLAEGLAHAVCNKNRIIAEALGSARRKHELSMNLAAERPCALSTARQRQHADKLGRVICCARSFERTLHTLHRDAKILFWSCP